MLTLRLTNNLRLFWHIPYTKWEISLRRWPRPDPCRFCFTAGPIEVWSYR